MRHLKRALCLFLFSLTAAMAAEKAPVEVVLDEYSIDMPHTLPPGATTFHITNKGQKSHSFKIQGPGIDVTLEAVVRPKASTDLQVTLEAGEYDVICPIGSHAAKGMTMKLVVGS
jgi:uncharacterized cupredoxin-like copper-binding protein